MCRRDSHCTVDTQTQKTGVTVVMPCADDMFAQKLPAAACVLHGFGKTAGLVQIGALGTLETPIALTNTLNVGLVYDAMVEYMAVSYTHLDVYKRQVRGSLLVTILMCLVAEAVFLYYSITNYYDGARYTLGVLALANHGRLEDLCIGCLVYTSRCV